MPQSLSCLYVHLVFSTKGRASMIPEEHRSDLHAYFGGIAKGIDCAPLAIGGTTDHVHILLRLHRKKTVSDAVRDLKSNSSSWMKSRRPEFSWQSGYGAFSVGEREVPGVKQYISSQEDHHANASFQDELRKLLREHNLEWDERYLWD
ncbi:MAG TPA: IS200/IS605 family transposase [Fimbriimonas sp.]